MFETESDLKTCGLRWKLDEDRTVIVKARRRILSGDHLFWNGKNVLGIYYCRANKISACRSQANWRGLIGERIRPSPQIGDFDGILLFKVTELRDIPRCFRKAAPKGAAARAS